MKDIQKEQPTIKLPIQHVGITDLKLPIFISTKNNEIQHTVADVDVFVDLDSESKGTHMSRLIAGVQQFSDLKLNQHQLSEIAKHIKESCEGTTSQIIYKFPYFMTKIAPVSKVPGLVHYDITFSLTNNFENNDIFTITLEILATSLCPCSKEISAAGAHNQRSKIKVMIEPNLNEWVWIEDIIKVVEDSASCEIYSVLKRPDEKYVTEKAYNNPVFVEDAVRNIYSQLDQDSKIKWFQVEVTNQESIHQHNAYSKINSEWMERYEKRNNNI